jgi:PEP-CTERM motif
MRLRSLLVVALLALPIAMKADTYVYTYTGADYTYSNVNNSPVNPPGTIAAPYSATDSVNGFFTITGQIDNLTNAIFTTGAFSFNDGAQTLSSDAGDTLFAFISTDANGMITSYVLQVANPSQTIDNIQIGNLGSPAGFGQELVDGVKINAGTNTDGSFAAPVPTPEPTSLAFLGTGLAGIAFQLRRRMLAV